MKLDRRKFLKKTARGTAGALVFPTILPSGVFPARGRTLPNDRINFALIGVGEMGSSHLRSFIEYDDVVIRAVCDVNRLDADHAAEFTNRRYSSEECKVYGDFRELLARKDIDAVLIATPDHWHALMGIEAARQGKHIYYEKPLSFFSLSARQ
ncbi:MAG: Gfo/Idh/MocA family oxidoreductase [Bacteroidales bacterium]